jgi:hypothetical protein
MFSSCDKATLRGRLGRHYRHVNLMPCAAGLFGFLHVKNILSRQVILMIGFHMSIMFEILHKLNRPFGSPSALASTQVHICA